MSAWHQASALLLLLPLEGGGRNATGLDRHVAARHDLARRSERARPSDGAPPAPLQGEEDPVASELRHGIVARLWRRRVRMP